MINNINYNDSQKTNNFLKILNQSNNTESQNFIDHMKNALQEVSQQQKNAEINAENFILNKTDNSLENIIIDLQKSTISMQMIVQVRNKIITAYQDIMNQQV